MAVSPQSMSSADLASRNGSLAGRIAAAKQSFRVWRITRFVDGHLREFPAPSVYPTKFAISLNQRQYCRMFVREHSYREMPWYSDRYYCGSDQFDDTGNHWIYSGHHRKRIWKDELLIQRLKELYVACGFSDFEVTCGWKIVLTIAQPVVLVTRAATHALVK